MNKIITFAACFVLAAQSFGQFSFQSNFPASMMDIPGGAIETSTGDFVNCGWSMFTLNIDGVLFETNSAGTVQWAKKYDGGFLAAYSFADIIQTTDGGYMVAGSHITGMFGNEELLLMKTDASGNVQWAKTYGGSQSDGALKVKQTSDGGYIATGWTKSFSTKDSSNVYIVKTNSTGTMLWDQVVQISTTDDDEGQDVIEVSNGYVITGYTSQVNGSDTTSDILLLKTNLSGVVQWQHTWGTNANDEQGYAVQELPSGEFLITGYSDAPVSGFDASDVIFMRTSTSGLRTWSTAYDIGFADIAASGFQTADGDYAAIGWTIENLFPLTMTAFLLKINPSTLGINISQHYSLGIATLMSEGVQTSDGGYLITGMDGVPVSGWNYHLTKTDGSGISSCNESTVSSVVRAFAPADETPAISTFSGGSASSDNPSVSPLTIAPAVSCFTPNCTAATLNTTQSNVSCNGGSTGSATVSGTGGGTPYTYQWDAAAGNQTTATATGLAAGTYDVTLTESGGCPAVTTVTITEPTALSATTSSINEACSQSNGSATATGSGGTPTYSYQWSASAGSQTTSTATGLSAGSYPVTVTDGNSCTYTTTVTVSATAGPTASSSSTNVTCNGSGNGTGTATPSGGTPSYSYQWDAGAGSQTTATATGLGAGTYSVTVTDANSCTAVTSVTITEPSALSASTSVVNETCGAGNGSATATPSGGTPSYSYQWDAAAGNQTTATATGLSAGTYSVTVYDANSCQYPTTVSITNSGGPSGTTTATDVLCNGNTTGTTSVSPTGGQTPYTYQWDASAGSQTTATATGLGAGTYSVTVTDANTCTYVTTATVNEPTALSASTVSTNDFCSQSNGTATVTASGSNSPYTYQWDAAAGNQTTSTATGLASGTYNVTVYDANSCSTTAGVTVNAVAGPAASVSGTDVNCNGGNDGQATASATGGSTPYTYQWDASAGNQTTATATGLAAGTYSVTVGDANGCTDVVSVTVTEPSALSATSTATDENCGAGNGDATAAPTGGTTPYSYQWDASASSQTTATATGLSAGSYSVTITDANGCTTTISATVNNIGGPSATTTANDVLCFGNTTGSATISATGGQTPYTYQWDANAGNQTTIMATGLAAGTYSVTVSDANSCSFVTTATVNQPTALNTSVSSTNDLCGQTNGTTTVTPSGGTSPYNYQWDAAAGNQTTATATGLGGGTYSVTVTDGNGCTATTGATVNAIAGPTANATSTDVNCNGGNDGQGTATASGGTTPYSYQWDAAAGNQTTASATGLTAGTYTVTVSDANSCSDVVSITITEPTALSLSVTTVDENCGQGNGSATAAVSGGSSPYTYLWDAAAGNQTTATATGLSAGSYSVTITDNNGCTSTSTALVNSSGGPSLTTTAIDETCSGTGDGSATVTATGSNTPFTYLWDDPGSQNTTTATGLGAGTYYVTVTDNGGCSTIDSVTVNAPAPVVAAISGTDTLCSGQSATLTATGGGSYSWDTGDNTASIQVTPATTTQYIVTVTVGQCTDEDTMTVVVNPTPSVAISGNTPICAGDSLTLAGSGSGAYTWSTGDTNTSIVVSPSSTTIYSLTVDNGLCSASDSVSVVVSPAQPTSITGQNDICEGSSLTLTASGGGTYIWSTGDTGSAITITPATATLYSVTVTNSCGTSSDSVNVGVWANPTADAGTDTTISSGGSLQLSGTGGSSYNWSPSTGLSCSDCQDPVAAPDGTTTYILTVTDNNGCAATDSITITVDATCEYFIPNIFSPNNDGINDLFYVRGKGFTIDRFFIYDRWGEKVFETNDPLVPWDGNYNGNPMNPAVFIYYLVGYCNSDGKEINEQGDVTLIR